MTWSDLVAMEPRLAALLDEARREPRGEPNYCANRKWYGYHLPGEDRGLKGRMRQLVGWNSPHVDRSPLGTPEAYTVAYETIYDALPDCSHDGICS